MYCGKLIQLGFVVQVSYAWDIILGKKMREREREREREDLIRGKENNCKCIAL